jgi:hypothetical protein
MIAVRDADPGHDPRRARRSGADADLHRVHARFDQELGAFLRADVARDDVRALGHSPRELDGIAHVLRMAVRRIDDDRVHFGAEELLDTLFEIASRPDRRAHAQPAVRVLRRQRMLRRLLYVLHGDQTAQAMIAVDDRQLLDPILVQDRLRLLEGRPLGSRYDAVLRHHLLDEDVGAFDEAKIAVREDADQAFVARDRYPRDAVLRHERERIGDRPLR